MRLTPLLAFLVLGACDGETPKDTGTPEDTDVGTDLVDADGDGALSTVDCDDGDATIHPGAAETCDGVDQDCDGTPDDGVGTAWYTDADGDGYGDASTEYVSCDAPAGTVSDGSDCDDTDAAYNPGAIEDDCADPEDYNCDGSVGFEDRDGDGFAACQECDDGAIAVNPSATEACNDVDDDCDGNVDEDGSTVFYADADGDGYGDAGGATVTACEAPEGYVADATDCDDADPAYNPGAAESCEDPVDYNCDGSIGYADADGDGSAACRDCDDANAAAYPGAAEACNAFDDDCDGTVDEADAADATTWYFDADADGYGRSTLAQVACDAPAGFVDNADDCDDLDDDDHPAAAETCDGEDDDCDGATDEADAIDPTTWYADADEDAHGDASVTTEACDAPAGYAPVGDDCDDTDATAYPGADEVCGGGDEDCDGTVDEDDAADAPDWYVDADGDGFGNDAYATRACAAPAGYAADGGDCDDGNGEVSPTSLESCNGGDDDCDGDVDESGALGELTWYRDADADGHGGAVALDACDMPAGYVAAQTDCDDTRDDVNPDMLEVCDAADVDENCDGAAEESGALGETDWHPDVDGDTYGDWTRPYAACDAPSGYVEDANDCDDAHASANPFGVEVCDPDDVDEDCDGEADDEDADGASGSSTFYVDADGDGYGSTSTVVACDVGSGRADNADDCDDAEAASNPAALEQCDDLDNDCDGTVDDDAIDATLYYPDDDDDGFGDATGTMVASCDGAPLGYRLDGTDCDDGDITVHPYAWEDSDNLVDDDCDGYTDAADPTTISAGPQTDDSSATVTLSGMSFPFCGTNRTTAYMISNGRITFGSGDTDLSESTTDFDDDTAIAVMWDDLNPGSSSGGDTWYIQYTDAVGFYWVDVREYGQTTTNNFSAVLFDDGRILLQYAGIAATDGLVGYSCAPGSAPSETDFTAAMDNLVEGRWGIGTGTATMYYELFSSDNDLDNRVIRMCGNPDSSTDNCAE